MAPKDGHDSSAPAKDAKVKVVTSFYAMQDFVTKVGGTHVEVTNLVPAGTEPHDWEPSPTDLATIQDADLLVYNGAGMESWVDDALDGLGSQAPKAVMAAEDIQLRSANDSKESEPHEHGLYDPHVWLSPKNAARELRTIADALMTADPSHATDYEANYQQWASELDRLDTEYEERLSATPHKTIFVSHEAFGYLCDAYGLTQVAITGMDAEGEPDAQTMASIINQAQTSGAKVIFSEDLVSPKIAQQIADATGAACEVLNPLEGLTQEQIDAGEDYMSIMQANLDALVKALSQGSTMVQNPKGEARLCLDRVWFSYGNEPILCGASLEVGSGELVTLAGENGAGKSTVIKLLLGELEPSSGSVRVLGQPVRSLSPHAWCRVGYMPQAQASSLANFPATVAEIVRASVVGSPRDARARADELLGELGLASLARHLVGELSGGQFQRVMLARALANRPQALLLDEPTSGLDAEATADLAQRMRALTARSVAVLLVTHDMARLEALTGPGAGAARLVRLEGGAIIDA